jgi:RHS repeat-associated protein
MGTLTSSNGSILDIIAPLVIESDGLLSDTGSGIIQSARSLTGDTQNLDLYNPRGMLRMAGNGTPGSPQLLEVMGRDFGEDPSLQGFTRNFVYGTLALANNTYVRLVDQSDNATGIGAEALYTNILLVPAGTTLDLNGLNLYARGVVNQGTIIGGTLIQIPDSGPIWLNTPTPGGIGIVGELDEWTFFGRAGREVSVWVNPGDNAQPSSIGPFLGFARVTLRDAADTILATASGGTSEAVVTLLHQPLPADGIYKIQIQATTAQATSTGNYVVAAWDSTPDVRPLLFNEVLLGQIETPFSVDRWFFSADQNEQIRFDLLNRTDPSVVFELTGPGGVLIDADVTDLELVTLPANGSYVLTARGSGGQYGGWYAARVDMVSVTDLPLDTLITGRISGNDDAQLFRVEVAGGSPLLAFLNDQTGGANRNEIYARFGSPPTRTVYDARYLSPGSADQTVLVAHAPAGVWYFLVYGDEVPVTGEFTIRASSSRVVVANATPDHHGIGGDAIITLHGAGFAPGAIVEMVGALGVFQAASVEVDSYNRLTATFSALSVPIDVYDIRVRLLDGSETTVPSGFTFTAGSAAAIRTRLVLPHALGWHGLGEIRVEYENTGAVAAPAPLLFLTATAAGVEGAFLTLDPSRLAEGFWTSALPEGFEHSVQFLARGAVPGLLQPGETGSVTVYYAGWRTPWALGERLQFHLRVLDTADTTPFDWPAFRDLMRPESIWPEAWELIYQNLIIQTGDTWGDYVNMLARNAQHLARLGRTVYDIGELLSYEIQQASGHWLDRNLATVTDAVLPAPGLDLRFERAFLPGLAERSRLGPLGRGWAILGPWDMRSASLADGTIVLTLSDGTRRIFQPDRRYLGRYLGMQPGDEGTITEVIGSSLLLTERDGTAIRLDAAGRVTSMEDPNGNRIDASYTDGRLVRLEHTSGASIQLDWNAAAGRITRLVDNDGRETHFTYDGANEHLIETRAPDGGVTRYTYAAGQEAMREHALVELETADQVSTQLTYDDRGRLASISAGDGTALSQFGYDDFGTVSITQPASATQPGGTERVWFDHRGLIARVVDARGFATSYEYDRAGNLVRVTDAEGRSTLYGYDAQGRNTSITNALGQRTRFAYDGPFDRRTSVTDALGRSWRYDFDERGNVIAIVDPLGRVERFTYDASGNELSRTNRRNQVVTSTYDTDGQLTGRTLQESGAETFTYDARGNLIATVDASGTTTYVYEAGTDRLLRIDAPGGKFLAYTYSAGGRRATMTDETGYVLTSHYDAAGRLQSLSDSAGVTQVAYEYDAAGLLARKTLGNGVFTLYRYGAAGNLLEQENRRADGTVLSRFFYAYDGRGLLAGLETLEGTWEYRHDDVGQLTGWTDPQNHVTDLFYDAAGNRGETRLDGVQTIYHVNALNQYTQVGTRLYQYDADGNLTRETDGSTVTTYVYDAFDRLVGASRGTSSWSYLYDALGNRVAATEGGATTRYTIDPMSPGAAAGEYQGGNLVARNVWGIGLISRLAAGAVGYLTFDARGNAAELTGAGGAAIASYAFSPFGVTTSALDPARNPFRFAGEWGARDETTGLGFLPSRPYDADLGRFTTPDLGAWARTASHPYAYLANQPLAAGDLARSRVVSPAARGSSETIAFRADPWELDPPPPEKPGIPTPPVGTPGQGGSLEPVVSNDPNQKTGPGGHGTGNHVPPQSTIPYRIDFENLGPGTTPTPARPATAPAQRVVITDQLAPDLDWQSFEFTGYGFGDHLFPLLTQLETGLTYHRTSRRMADRGIEFDVQIELDFDVQTGLLRAVFQAIDPLTQLPPNALVGFLPPEDGTGAGRGYVSFTVTPRPGTPSGTVIRNVAEIRFDANPPIRTNQVNPEDPAAGTDPLRESLFTIDALAPSSQVAPLPPTTTNPAIPLFWSGADDALGSGLASYDIYVSINGGDPIRIEEMTTATSKIYPAPHPGTYSFWSIARDHVDHEEGVPDSPDATIIVLPTTPTTLAVDAFQPTAAGFAAHLQLPFEASVLNLFDTATGALGPADITLVGAITGAVRGSLVIGTDQQTITFVATSGLLAPDTYTVTLRSATNGFRTPEGTLLDGNNDEVPGDDYVNTFTVDPPAANTVTVSIPDLVRGRTQAVNVPGNSTNGLPIRLANGQGITEATLELVYNPALLTISGVNPGPTVPGGWTFDLDLLTPGLARIHAFGLAPLATGALDLALLVAAVPADAPYTTKHVLDLRNITLRAGATPVPAIDDDAVHIATYLGDLNADGLISSGDVTLARRVTGGLDSGFASAQLADPRLVADITGDSLLTSGDITQLRRFIGGLSSPIPALGPAGTTIIGPDPLLYIPRDLVAQPGGLVTIPIWVENTSPEAIGLAGFDLIIEFDPSRFELITSGENRPRLGPAFTTSEDPFDLAFFANATKGTVHLTGNSLTGVDRILAPGERLPIAFITLRVGAKVPAGPSAINLRATHPTSGIPTSLSNSAATSLLLAPAPTNAPKDPVDGLVTIGKPYDSSGRKSPSIHVTNPRETTNVPVTQVVAGRTTEPLESLLVRRLPNRKILRTGAK